MKPSKIIATIKMHEGSRGTLEFTVVRLFLYYNISIGFITSGKFYSKEHLLTVRRSSSMFFTPFFDLCIFLTLCIVCLFVDIFNYEQFEIVFYRFLEVSFDTLFAFLFGANKK